MSCSRKLAAVKAKKRTVRPLRRSSSSSDGDGVSSVCSERLRPSANKNTTDSVLHKNKNSNSFPLLENKELNSEVEEMASLKVSFVDKTSMEKGDIGKGLRIVDLCPEDKKRIMNLVEELGKNVQEKRSLEGEVSYLKNNIIKCVSDMERLNTLQLNEQKSLRMEIASLKQDNKNLASDLELANNQKCLLEENASVKDSRNKNLEREKSSLRTQLKNVKKRLSHTTRVSELCKTDLRSAVRYLRCYEREPSAAVEEVETQTEGGGSVVDVPTADSRASHTTVSGAENQLLSELFFKSLAIPSEMESIFFLSPPFNNSTMDRNLWDIYTPNNYNNTY